MKTQAENIQLFEEARKLKEALRAELHNKARNNNQTMSFQTASNVNNDKLRKCM